MLTLSEVVAKAMQTAAETIRPTAVWFTQHDWVAVWHDTKGETVKVSTSRNWDSSCFSTAAKYRLVGDQYVRER